MSTEKKISVIIPAKNEAECIGAVLDELPKELIHEIIVVDGHSTDGTLDVVRERGVTVYVQESRGYGEAVSTGLRHATGEYVTFLDADGSYDPSALHELLVRLEQGYDAVFCSRYLPESGSDDDTIIRFIGNKFFTLLLRQLHGVKISDSLFLYVLTRRSVFDKFEMESMNFEWCTEFPIKLHNAGFKYCEIPSHERERIAGVSKVNAFTDGLEILWAMLKLKFQKTSHSS